MKHTAPKSVVGFTILELLAVIAITIILISLATSGLLYLQNSITLDNAIREVKAEIQATQNNARNSLVVRNGPSSGNLSTNDISVGWISNITNSSNGVLITKRSIYFRPTSYDMSLLREDIKTTFVKASAQNISCTGTTLYRNGAQLKFSTRDLLCSDSSKGENDYLTHFIPGIQLSTPTGIPQCSLVGSNSLNLFFTSGYGEAVSNDSSTNACQIKVENRSAFKNSRALRITKDTGSISVCGNNC